MERTIFEKGGRSTSRAPVARVALVDDHPLWAESVQLALERTDRFKIVALAATELEAVECIRETRPDIALVDVRLPSGTEGLNVARATLDVSPNTKIVMLTGSDDPSHVREAVAIGIRGYLSKDIGILQLAHAVDCVDSGLDVYSHRAMELVSDDDSREACPLTVHEQALLGLAADGVSLEDIASCVCSSRSKVNRDLLLIQRKLQTANRTQAIVHAVRRGWI